jgi:hypothetical protein
MYNICMCETPLCNLFVQLIYTNKMHIKRRTFLRDLWVRLLPTGMKFNKIQKDLQSFKDLY